MVESAEYSCKVLRPFTTSLKQFCQKISFDYIQQLLLERRYIHVVWTVSSVEKNYVHMFSSKTIS